MQLFKASLRGPVSQTYTDVTAVAMAAHSALNPLRSILPRSIMSAWTPKTVPLSKYSEELADLLHQCFKTYDEKLQTRRASVLWEKETIDKIPERE